MRLHTCRFAVRVASSLAILFAASACGEDDGRSPGLGGSGCSGASCSSHDAAPDGSGPDGPDGLDATTEESDVGADTAVADAVAEGYDGPVGNMAGTIFLTSPPLFPVDRNGEYPLSFPASLSVWAYGKEYTGSFEPSTGYALSEVPVGSWTFLVRDVGGENGVLDSALELTVDEGTNSHDIPVFGRNSFVVIYGGLTPPIIRDPALAQVVLSFEACAAQGGGRLAGVTVDAPSGTQGVLYHSGILWELGTPSGTSEYGVAILANVPATEYPGANVPASYNYQGQSYSIPPFALFRGGIIRVVVVHPC